LWSNAGALTLTVTKAKASGSGANTSAIVLGTISATAWDALAWSYDPTGGDGYGILRANLNGTAPSEVTTGVAPLQPVTSVLRLGADGVGGNYYAGTLTDFHFSASISSAATLAQMVASQQSLLTTKPAAGAETYTGPGGLCCPVDDAHCYWTPVNVPCIKSTGIDLRGAASNLLSNSTMATGWTNSATVVANAILAPDGTVTGASVTGTGNNYQTLTGGKTCAVWLKAGTGSTALLADTGVAHTCTINLATGASVPSGAGISCAAGSGWVAGGWARYSYTLTGTTGLFDVESGSANTIYSYTPTCEAGTTPGRAFATAGTPFSGPADSLSVPQVAGALYDSINGGAWSLISANPIVLPVPGSYTGLKQCRNATCKP
jgi:hypothetical protein